MITQILKIIKGLLYRTPLRLEMDDPSAHRHSWDLGYHHARRGKDAEPDNPAIGDREAYIAGYKSSRKEGVQEPTSQIRSSPFNPPEQRTEPDPGSSQHGEVDDDHPTKHIRFDKYIKDDADRLMKTGFPPDKRYFSFNNNDRVLSTRTAFLSAGQSIIDSDPELSEIWNSIEPAKNRLKNTLKEYDNLSHMSRSYGGWDSMRLADNLRIHEDDLRLKIKIASQAFKIRLGASARNHISERQYDKRKETFVSGMLSKAHKGQETARGIRKLSGVKGELGDSAHIVSDYAKNMFDMWGPVAELALKKIKRIIMVPPDVRAHYSGANGTIAFSTSRNLAHEIGHHIEDFMSIGNQHGKKWGIPPSTNNSYWANRLIQRGKGDPVLLSELTGMEAYDEEKEVALDDKWASPYMGKVYKYPGSTEIVSMLNEDFHKKDDPIDHVKRFKQLKRLRLDAETRVPVSPILESQLKEDKSLLVEFAGYVSLALKGSAERANTNWIKSSSFTTSSQLPPPETGNPSNIQPKGFSWSGP